MAGVQDGREPGLNETWSGVVLKDKETAAAFSDAFWFVARKEAESLCRTEKGAADLARLVLAEMRRDYSERPLPKDVCTEVIVRTCMIFGKWGYDERILEERVQKLRAERKETKKEVVPRAEFAGIPSAAREEKTVPPENQPPQDSVRMPFSEETDKNVFDTIGAAEPEPEVEAVTVEDEQDYAPQPEAPRVPRRRTARKTESLRAEESGRYAEKTDRSFPHLYESPQIQINFMSPDWQGQKPVVQYVYPESGSRRRTRTENPSAAPNGSPAEPVREEQQPDPIPESGNRKKLFSKEKDAAKPARAESGDRLLKGIMIAAGVASVASVGFLIWQIFFA